MNERLPVRRQGRRAFPSVPPKSVPKARPVGYRHPPLQIPLLPQQPPRHARGAALSFPDIEEIVPLERFEASGRPLPVARPADQQRPGPEFFLGIFLGYSLERPALCRRKRRPAFTEPIVDLLCFLRGQLFYPGLRTGGSGFARRCWKRRSAAPVIRRLRAWFVCVCKANGDGCGDAPPKCNGAATELRDNSRTSWAPPSSFNLDSHSPHLNLSLVAVKGACPRGAVMVRTDRSSGRDSRRRIVASTGRPSSPNPTLPPALVFRAPVCNPRPLSEGSSKQGGGCTIGYDRNSQEEQALLQNQLAVQEKLGVYIPKYTAADAPSTATRCCLPFSEGNTEGFF